jgi:glycosyltransferase involved in cell wall biosynthesis
LSLSILILTYNEEMNLPACLDSVREFSDVVVLDSFSKDRTCDIVRERGARLYQRVFDDFGSQRNFALDSIEFQNRWVFHLDADERFTPELRRECLDVIRMDEHSGYMVPSKLMFQDRWLRFSGMYPTFQMRLLKLGELRFIQHGHGQREANPARGIGRLREPYLHYNFSKGLDDWFAKHNRYSSQEAAEALRVLDAGEASIMNLFARDGVARRRALKALSFRLPFRSTLRFLYMYVFRLGFLDVSAGLDYCRLMATYEWMTVLKMREMRQSRSTPER